MERFHYFSELFFQFYLCVILVFCFQLDRGAGIAGVVFAVLVIAVIGKILQTLFQLF